MTKVLLNENVLYLKNDLMNLGYDVITVVDLRRGGWRYKGDYQLIKYAEENKVILITNDKEVIDNCAENNILCLGILGLHRQAEVAYLDGTLKRLM